MSTQNDIARLPTVVKRLLACHEAFRRLGFLPDQIFVLTSKAGELCGEPLCAYSRLDAQGKQFHVNCGRLDDVKPGWEERFEQTWQRAVALWNAAGDQGSNPHPDPLRTNCKAHQAIYDSYMPPPAREGLVRRLVKRGFRLTGKQD